MTDNQLVGRWFSHSTEDRIIQVISEPNNRGANLLVEVATLKDGRLTNHRLMRQETLMREYYATDSEFDPTIKEYEMTNDPTEDPITAPTAEEIAGYQDSTDYDTAVAAGEVTPEFTPTDEPAAELTEDPPAPTPSSPRAALLTAADDFALATLGSPTQYQEWKENFIVALDGILTMGPNEAGWYADDNPGNPNLALRDANGQWWGFMPNGMAMQCDWVYIQSVWDATTLHLVKAMS